MTDMDPEDFFNNMKKFLGHGNVRVKKKIPATEEEVNEFMALEGFRLNATKAASILKAKQNLFWSKIQLRTGETDAHLHWNDKEAIIEVVEDVQEAQDGFPD